MDLDLSLGGSGLKFCKEDLNMAAINFLLENLKGLSIIPPFCTIYGLNNMNI